MSQRGTKHQISSILRERDHLWELVKSYGNVADDLRTREGDASALAASVCDAAQPIVERIGELTKQATAMAASLRTPKTEFAGRHLQVGRR